MVLRSVLPACIALFAATCQAGEGYYLQASALGADTPGLRDLSEDFSHSFGIGGEIGTFVSEGFALGVRLGYQNNDAHRRARGLGGVLALEEETWDTDVYEALVNTTCWIPRSSGLVLGAGAGFSRCSVENVLRGVGWSASGPVFQLFSGAQVTFDNEFMLFVRVGYAHRDFGSVDGRDEVSGDVTRLELDLSSIYIELGFGGHTRRPWSQYP